MKSFSTRFKTKERITTEKLFDANTNEFEYVSLGQSQSLDII